MKEDVKRVLRLEQPLKIREIAKRTGHDRSAVNAFLDRNRDVFTQNAAFEWSLAEEQELVVVFSDVEWLTVEQFETALCDIGSPLESDAGHIVFRLTSRLLIDALARLLAISNQVADKGKAVTIDLSSCKDKASYLSRIGFFDLLSPVITVFPERPQTSLAQIHRGGNSGVMELAEISLDVRNDDVPEQLMERFKEVAGEMHVTTMLTMIGELFDNVHDVDRNNSVTATSTTAHGKARPW
ncbi:hypothetical protein [Paraburkholderia bannensis]|uniref:hypothetical protein n=1 Tax=Paraburkholderia bannensis TaxID=765414 RepID=UPI0004833BF3|nr:hypothetical protein [Paraburkholderia bannensis]